MVVLEQWGGEAVHGRGRPPVGTFGEDDMSAPSGDPRAEQPLPCSRSPRRVSDPASALG